MSINSQIKKIVFYLSIMLFIITSCSGCGGSNNPLEPVETVPSNLSLTIDIIGADANNPNGDGTGVIKCNASAKNAVSYGYKLDNGSEVTSTSGSLDFTYTDEGTNNHIVTVFAYSSTGSSINTTNQIMVKVASSSFSTLIFSDEFDTDGSPDSTKWGYDLGNGSDGWGNNELEYYTKRSDNVTVSGGFLKITAKKEDYQGFRYTSTRMLTQGKFDFTYGRVEVRAKLPIGGGTWPAIWMLGSSISTDGWPAAGEIDIMEHIGNEQGKIHSSIHTRSSFGNTVNTMSKMVSDVSTAFHIYGVKWTQNAIEFSIDDEVYYTYNPSTKNTSTWPFYANQFIILNVAMGGNFGGNVDSNFTQSTMEIDYVRVYQ